MSFPISAEQFQLFHTIDRHVYSRLVNHPGFDPYQSKIIVAFWNWLEMIGYTNFIKNMQEVNDVSLKVLAQEAITCINFLNHQSFPGFIDNDKFVPLMRVLVHQDFSLGFVYENREDAKRKIDLFMKEVCDIAFYGIVPSNLANEFQSVVPCDESSVLNRGNVASEVQSWVPYSESNVPNAVQPSVPYSESWLHNVRNVANVAQPWVPYNESNVPNVVQPWVPYSESFLHDGRTVANVVQPRVPYSESTLHDGRNVATGVQALVLNGRNVANAVQSWVPPYSESLLLNGRNVADGVQSCVPPSSDSLLLNGRNVASGVPSLVPRSESLVYNGRNMATGVQSLVPRSESLVNSGQILVPYSESQSQFSHGLQDNECHSQMGVSKAAANVTQDLPSTAPQDERTLFISFSKGHNITKLELREHITRNYGNCVEAVYMRNCPNPLFAHVSLRSPLVLEEILGDNEMVKFSINGKDAWARHAVSKRREQLPLH